jgi:methionine biosynthesis protein MetW
MSSPNASVRRLNDDSWKGHLARGKGRPDPANEFGVEIARLVGTGKRVLDLGCGTGKCLAPLAAAGNDVTGVDISPEAATVCRQHGFRVFELDLENEDLSELLADGPFDAVLMTDIVEHLIDPLAVLKNKVRILLKPQGQCLATVPNFVYLRYRVELLSGRIPHFGNDDATGYDPPRPYNLGHKTLFNRRNLGETFALAGFVNVRVGPELMSQSLNRFWRIPGLAQVRNVIKRTWPSLLAARFIVTAEKPA